MAVLMDNEVFALRDNEVIQFFYEHPQDGRVLAVMARSVEMPEGPKDAIRPCDGAPVESAAILAAEIGAATGAWHWVQISPPSKERIGDHMFDNGLTRDRWYYLRVTTAVALLLLLAVPGYGQEPTTVITQKHADGSSEVYRTPSSDTNVRGNVVRNALAQNQPGDTYEAAAGTFTFTAPLSLRDIVLTGQGKDATFFRNNGIHSDKVGGAFGIGNTTLDSITVSSKSDPDYEDDRCLSLDNIPKGATVNTTIRNARIEAGAWALYGWNGEAYWNLTLDNVEVYSGAQCLTGQGSGQDNNQMFVIRNSVFDVDPTRCKCSQNQTIRNSVYGGSLAIALRGGTHSFENVRIIARGATGIANVACITDTYENGPRDTMKITVNNLECTVIPNGTPLANCWDVRLQNDKVRAAAKFGGKLVGSGEFDSLRMWAPGSGGGK